MNNRKKIRQDKATERNEARAQRSDEEQLQILKDRGAQGGKEWNRLIFKKR